jgi:hypothetical protein
MGVFSFMTGMPTSKADAGHDFYEVGLRTFLIVLSIAFYEEFFPP